MPKVRGTCSVPGCGRPHRGRGFCTPHYKRWAKHGDPLAGRICNDDAARFWASVDVRGPDECWPWRRPLVRGYGKFWSAGRKFGAHRFAYELLVGPIPDALTLDHECHNADDACAGGESCPHRACVNPRHLAFATLGENVLSGKSPAALNARKTHCYRGHPLSGDNIYVDAKGWRTCKVCVSAKNKRQRARRKARQ